MASGLKFRINEEEELYSLCSEHRGADQQCSYCASDPGLCFHLCRKQFSHDAAQMNKRGRGEVSESCTTYAYFFLFIHTIFIEGNTLFNSKTTIQLYTYSHALALV